MAATTLSNTTNPVHKCFQKFLSEVGTSEPSSEFLAGKQLQVSALVREDEMFRQGRPMREGVEHEMEGALYTLAKGCSKVCAGCSAMELRGSTQESHFHGTVTISVTTRCTSAGYCPRSESLYHDPGVDWRATAAKYLPREVEANLESVEIAMLMAEPYVSAKPKMEPAVEPSSTPKTTASLVW